MYDSLSVKDIFRAPKRNIRKCFTHNKFCSRSQLSDRSDSLVYVHIGKCGGSSLAWAIAESKSLSKEFKQIYRCHLEPPPILYHARYLIVVRNPIDRMVSAFNFEMKKAASRHNRRSSAWRTEFFGKYNSINQLAESLYCDGNLSPSVARDLESVPHLGKCIAYYLRDLQEGISKDQIWAVMAQESLDADIQKFLNVRNKKAIHREGSPSAAQATGKFLSEEARVNLARYLQADFDILERLTSNFGIDDELRKAILKR